MKLTKLQIEMIEHRLEVPDAMAEVLADALDISYTKAEELVDIFAPTLLKKLQTPHAELCYSERQMIMDIQTDQSFIACAENALGDLWPDHNGTPMTELRLSRFIASKESLEEKLEKVLAIS